METVISILKSSLHAIEVVIALGVLVTVHEFGHFIIAKIIGMRVDEFAVGFGKSLFSFRRGETLYSLRAIPLGGYNRIYGMEIEDDDDNDIEDVDTERAFNSYPPSKRGAVILAGSIMNLVLAVVLIFSLRFFWGDEIPQIHSVNPNGPAWSGGIREGDVILSIGGEKTWGLNVSERIQEASSVQGGVKVLVERQDEVIPVTINPITIRDVDRKFWDLGVVFYPDGSIAQVIPGSSAEKLGLQLGDYVNIKDGKIAERLVDVEGEKYVAVDVRRFDQGFTLAYPLSGVERLRQDFSGIGFHFSDNWEIIEVEEFNPFTYMPSQANLRKVKQSSKIVSVTYTNALGEKTTVAVEDLEFGVDNPLDAVSYGTIQVLFEGDTNPKVFNPDEGRRIFGVSPQSKLTNIVRDIDTRGAAFEAGIRDGDVIIAIGNEPVHNGISVLTRLEFIHQATRGAGYLLLYDPEHIADAEKEIPVVPAVTGQGSLVEDLLILEDHPAEDVELFTPGYSPYFSPVSEYVTLKVQRGEELHNFILNLRPPNDNISLGEHLGFSFPIAYRSVGAIESVKRGFVETGYFLRYISDSLNMLFTGGARLRDLSGPLGIVTMTYRFAESGLKSLLNIVVLLSVNLAIINLFPLPALDGGRLVFLLLEMVFRRPVVSVKVENLIHLAGILLLLMVIVYITFFDILRISQWW